MISTLFFVPSVPCKCVTACATCHGAAGKTRARLSAGGGTGAGVVTRGRKVRRVEKTIAKEGGKDANQGGESRGGYVSPISGNTVTKFQAEACTPSEREASTSNPTLYQNGDPLGRKELGKSVVRWITHGMRAMAADFAAAEAQGGSSEDVRERMGILVKPPAPTNGSDSVGETAATMTPTVTAGTLSFVTQAQPYLQAVPMPKGVEALCLRACSHYPTLFDHFQRELREALLDLQRRSLVDDWRATESWTLLKEFAASGQHRAVVRKPPQAKPTHSSLGLDLDKTKMIQARIDDFVQHMSHLLRIERDAEMGFAQEELNAISMPDEDMDPSKPLEFLVNEGQFQHEQGNTICNLIATSSSIGLGGMHLIMFRVEGNRNLPPTTLSPGDHVCVRLHDSQGAGAASSMQGFVDSLGEDSCSITVALECRHGDPTFSNLFGKSVCIDRINGLADAVTYERNCEALMLLQSRGLRKKNPSISIVATLFGDRNDVHCLEENKVINWSAADINDLLDIARYDDSQQNAIALGLNRKRPLLAIQGPPGTGKTGLLKELITFAVSQGERVLVAAPTNTAVDNMVEKLLETSLSIVRVGNPARISATVASKSLAEIVNVKLANFKREFARKKAELRKDLRQCLKDDSVAAGIRQLLKQLGKTLKKKEKDTIKEVLSNAQVVLSTNTSTADPLIRGLGCFDLVIIDEAGQAIEPSCWIPILQGKRCILAGDQCQLAPVLMSKKALQGGLGVSLLARAFPMHDGLLAAKLTTQYRMHDIIASWASKEMYDGFLKSSSIVSTHLLIDSPSVKANWITECPLLLLDTRMPFGALSIDCEERLDPAGTGSFYNEGEANIVVQHVLTLIYSGVPPVTIAVQSPYVAQVQLLQEKLNDLPVAYGVEVATIDSFQGREADAVVISMVRSNTLGVVGFLGDSRRMNVAVTRARKHVVLVCDSSTICHNAFLARLLRHIRQFGSVRHASPDSYDEFGLRMYPNIQSLS